MTRFFHWLHKLLLIKEIIAQNGEVHFRRYRLLSTPWLCIYVHRIMVSDYEKHMHSHPRAFSSLILRGAYQEDTTYSPDQYDIHSHIYKAGDIVSHGSKDFHHLTLLTKEVWSLFFSYGKRKDWGYLLNENEWVQHQDYRDLKHQNQDFSLRAKPIE